MIVKFSDTLRMVGQPAGFSVPAVIDGRPVRDPLRLDLPRTPLFGGQNILCVAMYSALQGLLTRSSESWQPAAIQLGFGGDYDQPADPDTQPPADQAERIPPLYTDAYVRKPLFLAPIVLAQPDNTVDGSPYRCVFTSIVKPIEAITDVGDPARPFINELGLLSAGGDLLAHYVFPVDSGVTASRRVKTDLEWWVIRWTIEIVATAVEE